MDSSAALAVTKRKGNGKMRHIKVGMLWVQDKQEDGELEYSKVAGADNPGDLFTKHLGKATIDKHMEVLGQVYQDGRAHKGLEI